MMGHLQGAVNSTGFQVLNTYFKNPKLHLANGFRKLLTGLVPSSCKKKTASACVPPPLEK